MTFDLFSFTAPFLDFLNEFRFLSVFGIVYFGGETSIVSIPGSYI